MNTSIPLKSAVIRSKLLKRQLLWPAIVLVFSAVLLIGRAIYLNHPDILLDDAYISFRYAVNLANGNGLVFNPGERVEGYTNFLWTVLLASAYSAGIEIEAAARVLSALAGLGAILILYLSASSLFTEHRSSGLGLARDSSGMILAATGVLLFAGMGSQARHIVSGMETLFFVFWVNLAIYCLLFTRRPFLTGLTFALAAMTRPEGVIYFGLAFAFAAFLRPAPESRKLPYLARMAAIFILIYGAYFLWRYSYYGYLFPNTYYAKASDFSFARLERGWEILLSLITSWRIELVLLLAAFALFSLRSRPKLVLYAAVVLITFVYFIYVGGDFVVWFGPRFLMPALPSLLILCAEGIRRLTPSRLTPESASPWIRIGMIGVLLFIAVWLSWPAQFYRGQELTVQMRGWKELGKWVEQHTPETAHIATDAAGLIPFYSGRYTIDMLGLNDLHIAHLDIQGFGGGIVAHEKFDPTYILERQPDCIVSTWMDQAGQPVSAGLLNVLAEFNRSYRLTAVAKIQYGPPENGQWVIQPASYSQELYDQGYWTGLYCRK